MNMAHNDDSSRRGKGLAQRFSSGGMIMREREPLNLEMPFNSLNGFLTPVEHFFVRSHFAVPPIDVKTWRLKIEGDVERPLTLSLRDLLKMDSVTMPVTLECAGNGRAFLVPQAKGAQWERGAVSNAEWTGVRLTDVLRRAGLKTSARELIFEGADQGEIKEPPGPAGKIHYARSMSVAKAMDDVLLAFKMNGEELTPAHGAPVRVIVPGWYGMASVKWLTRIIASAEPFNGYYQTVDYAYWERGPSAPSLVPITEMQVKAQIARPGFADAVRAGQTYRVTGARVDHRGGNYRKWKSAPMAARHGTTRACSGSQSATRGGFGSIHGACRRNRAKQRSWFARPILQAARNRWNATRIVAATS